MMEDIITKSVVVENSGVGHVLHSRDERHDLRDDVTGRADLHQVHRLVSRNVVPLPNKFNHYLFLLL